MSEMIKTPDVRQVGRMAVQGVVRTAQAVSLAVRTLERAGSAIAKKMSVGIESLEIGNGRTTSVEVAAPIPLQNSMIDERSRRQEAIVESEQVDRTEAIIRATLETIAAQDLHADPETLEAGISQFLAADSREIECASDALIRQVTHQDFALVQQNLVMHCRGALEAIGFIDIDSVGPVVEVDENGHEVTVQTISGVNSDHRRIVAEIRSDANCGLGHAAEVVGPHDQHCKRIIQSYWSELARRGVGGDEPPEQTSTGGIPRMQSSKRLVKRIFGRNRKQASTVNRRSDKENSRRRRLAGIARRLQRTSR